MTDTPSAPTQPIIALPAAVDRGVAELPPEVLLDLNAKVEGISEEEMVGKFMAEIVMDDSNSIIYFGTQAQSQLTEISDLMLEGVRNKETGQAGQALNDMVGRLRDLKLDGIDPSKRPSWLARLFGARSKVESFLNQYAEVRGQIDSLSDNLERHKTGLLTDVASLDRLYEANLDYFHTLELYIQAGERKLSELDDAIIPDFAKEVEASGDVVDAQRLRDLRTSRDDLERRVHDLKLTRQVTMQSLPSIRLVQENDKALVNKINSTLANTVPLWRQQMARAVTIMRSADAANTLKEASDLTNELLTANADQLREANRETREQIERGIFDIEAVKQANDQLIATIEDSLQINEQGRAMRREAEDTLAACEAELKAMLKASQSRASQAPAEEPAAEVPASEEVVAEIAADAETTAEPEAAGEPETAGKPVAAAEPEADEDDSKPAAS
jgi:uncharacterized protein YaaN involved in tellurite resistance